MKQRCLVLYAMPYKLTDEKTGEVNEGISTTYLPSDNLDPVVDRSGALGIMTCKQSLPIEWLDKFKIVPGFYDIEFKMKSVQGKPVMTPVSIEFAAQAQLTEVAGSDPDKDLKHTENKK